MPYADPEAKRAHDAAYFRANREQRLAYQKVWAARNHPKVLRMAHERYVRTDIRKRFAGRANRKAAEYGRPTEALDYTTLPLGPWFCTYCGTYCESWDHVQQLALGGANTVDNLVPSCLPCNQKRPRRLRRAVPDACKRGHPYAVYGRQVRPPGSGRKCRACDLDRYYARTGRPRAAEENVA